MCQCGALTVPFSDSMSERETSRRRRPPGPPFRLECAGCPPLPADRCMAVVRQAIIDAIWLARNAATRLGAASRLESTPPSRRTRQIFHDFFGHDPSRPVPWADNQPSGLSVAYRLRRCAEELAGGRTVTYRCVTKCLTPTTNAQTEASVNPSLIELCPPFFNPPTGLPLSNRFFRGGVVLHEMLHLLFYEFFHHPDHWSGDPVRRRDNPHCYEAFVLQLAGHTPDPSDVEQCRQQPA
jgi:hypothetical protein